MNIGIDLGGSHIGMGLVNGEEIVKKSEYNFLIEEKYNVEEIIRKFIYAELDDFLKNINIDEIEKIGIAVPRKTKKW